MSVKRGSNAAADSDGRARLRLRAEGKRIQKHDIQDVLEPQAKTKAGLERRTDQKRESTQPLPDLEEEATSTVAVRSGSAQIQGGSSSSTDVLVESSVAAIVSVEDLVQNSVPISTSVGIEPASAGKSDRFVFNESKARDFEKLTNLVLTSDKDPAGNRCKGS